MKKFSVIGALCLLPLWSLQAWIGGPFSNNSYFGAGGDDGVYEAAATAVNGVGVYRISVGNEFAGINPAGVTASGGAQKAVTGNQIIKTTGVASGNTIIGAYNGQQNIWFFQGQSYLGSALGTVNSAQGTVFAVGNAPLNGNTGGTVNVLSSGFTANLQETGPFIAARAFSGTGQGQVRTSTGGAIGGQNQFNFTVFGTRVSTQLTFGL